VIEQTVASRPRFVLASSDRALCLPTPGAAIADERLRCGPMVTVG
jgi:hypothetical protein